MRRYPSPSSISYSFGPGPLTPAVKIILWTNIAVFLLTQFGPRGAVFEWFGLTPEHVFERLRVWQPATYMFLHGDLAHILFNMLMLWMFGVELERRWGTRFFAQYYGATGLGAAVTMLVTSLLPFTFATLMYSSVTVGASGALYGLLLAYGLYYPDRPIYMYFLFPVPAKYFVMIVGAISFFLALNAPGGGIAHMAHLGGIVVGYLYLRSGRGGGRLTSEIKYRYLKWKMNRMRRKFDVYSGGRGTGWDRNVH